MGPYIFTKLMRPLLKHWRASVYKIVVYLGDGMGATRILYLLIYIKPPELGQIY